MNSDCSDCKVQKGSRFIVQPVRKLYFNSWFSVNHYPTVEEKNEFFCYTVTSSGQKMIISFHNEVYLYLYITYSHLKSRGKPTLMILSGQKDIIVNNYDITSYLIFMIIPTHTIIYGEDYNQKFIKETAKYFVPNYTPVLPK